MRPQMKPTDIDSLVENIRILFIKRSSETMSPSWDLERDANSLLDICEVKPKSREDAISQRIQTSLSLSQSANPQKDFSRLYDAYMKLTESNYYYKDCSSSTEAKKLLHAKSVGTFIIRDSSDPRFLYALSVKTERGTTSIRILYEKGQFKMDSVETLKKQMPSFDSVSELVEFYINLTKYDSKGRCRWTDGSGMENTQVKLKQPMFHSVPSLSHSCRITINRSLDKRFNKRNLHTLDQLPPSLRRYLDEYPFCH